MNFRDLLVAAKAGDEAAGQSLYEMYKPYIRRYSYLSGRFDCDLYQEQVLKFFCCVQNFSLEFPQTCNDREESR